MNAADVTLGPPAPMAGGEVLRRDPNTTGNGRSASSEPTAQRRVG